MKFIELNADASVENKTGETSVHQVSRGQISSRERGVGDNGVLVAQLLLERGADANVSDDNDQTPLHLASYFGRIEIVRVLLNAGANANAKNAQGQTPLHLVSQSPYDSKGDGVGVAQLLLEHGADVNAQDKNHATPSDLASYHERTEIASLLLHCGDKADAKIDQGPTPHQLGLEGVQFHDPSEHI